MTDLDKLIQSSYIKTTVYKHNEIEIPLTQPPTLDVFKKFYEVQDKYPQVTDYLKNPNKDEMDQETVDRIIVDLRIYERDLVVEIAKLCMKSITLQDESLVRLAEQEPGFPNAIMNISGLSILIAKHEELPNPTESPVSTD